LQTFFKLREKAVIELHHYPTADEIHAVELAARRLRAETIACGLRAAARGLGTLAVRVIRVFVSGTRRAAVAARLLRA